MTATTPSRHTMPDRDLVHPELVPAETPRQKALRYVSAAIRISLGWVFLWAFVDKLFGLGHETASKAAWINGGSPTQGFLKFAAAGPFKDFYNGCAGAAWADWLFLLGLLAIAVGLLAGVAMRVTAAAGAAMLILMWTAVLPPENNLFMDDHIIYALVIVALALGKAGDTVGLGQQWAKLPVVKDHGWMQ